MNRANYSVLPTTLLPLHLLSLPSLLSTISTFLLVLVILLDGLIKTSAPGSIIHPSPTSFGPELKDANWLGGIGLVLAGFGGHAVVPSLARDMRNPHHFDQVINKAFAIAAGVSFVAGAAGYLMIGNTVSDEVSRVCDSRPINEGRKAESAESGGVNSAQRLTTDHSRFDARQVWVSEILEPFRSLDDRHHPTD